MHVRTQLQEDQGPTWVQLTYIDVTGTGHVRPRLVVSFHATLLRETTPARLVQSEAKLLVDGELRGVGTCSPLGESIPYGVHDIRVLLNYEIALSPEALNCIEEQLRGTRLT
jgi:hypothetical protein